MLKIYPANTQVCASKTPLQRKGSATAKTVLWWAASLALNPRALAEANYIDENARIRIIRSSGKS
jgi:hypothetical protein